MVPDSYNPAKPGQGKIEIAASLVEEVCDHHAAMIPEGAGSLRHYYLERAMYFLEKALKVELKLKQESCHGDELGGGRVEVTRFDQVVHGEEEAEEDPR